jgi:class 3 adenylate cyclase
MGVSGLPSGTVTFLFTDVVGSSGLWESVPSVMAAVMARHDSMLRGAIDAGGGHVFASGGDGVAAVFGRADEAIAAAVAAQLALLAEPWPPEVPLSVRMGVHSGEADERDGDFFGSAVNRAARVMSVAQGGQVLVSALSAQVAGRVPGVEFVSVGERRLRGMVEPLELCVVAVDGLVQTPPALEVVRGNLPRPATEFVGDVGALQQRVSELSSRRLVTLTGPGGVGKTRMAVEVGGLVGDQFPGGVWLVELAAVTDGEVVPAVVLSVLGAQPQPGMSISESIVEWLNARATLLILDNGEHLLDAVAALVNEIVAGSASTTVVVTSREPLGVAGEVVRPVPSLPVEAEAVQLFTERAAAVSEGFVVDDSNRADVVAVCARLDGIPLAIELAAARVRTLSPAEILGRLDDRFRLLRRSW